MKIISKPNVIFEVPSRVKAFALCRGGLHEFTMSSESNFTGKIERLVVLSQGNQQSFSKLLIAKLYFDELNKLEWEIIYRSNLVLKKEIYLGLKALLLIPKKVVRERMEILSSYGLLNFPKLSWYNGTKGQLRSFLLRETLQTSTFPKYSGYSKHHLDQGTLPTERPESPPFEETDDFEFDDEVIYHFLTVGKFPFQG